MLMFEFGLVLDLGGRGGVYIYPIVFTIYHTSDIQPLFKLQPVQMLVVSNHIKGLFKWLSGLTVSLALNITQDHVIFIIP